MGVDHVHGAVIVRGDHAWQQWMAAELAMAGCAVEVVDGLLDVADAARAVPVEVVAVAMEAATPEVIDQLAASLPDASIIVGTDPQHRDAALEALRHGACDCVPESADDSTVLCVVQRAIARAEQRHAERVEREKLAAEVERCTSEIHRIQHDLQAKASALREVLGQIDTERGEIRREVMNNVDRLAMPMVRVLRSKIPGAERRLLDQLEQALSAIAAPLGARLDRRVSSLTPAELRLCHLIKDGLGVKEIARMEKLSSHTIAAHRRSIRRKLGIAHQKVNLSTYLRSLLSEAEPAEAQGKLEARTAA